MTDKKLIDNEIVKELERYSDVSDSDITTTCFKTRLLKEIYLFINRLQAENEWLKEEICIQHKIIDERGAEVLRHDRCIRTLHEKLETAKAEAYKECIEKVHQLIHPEYAKLHKQIVNLLKELVGDK